jgi:hypothetical protein
MAMGNGDVVIRLSDGRTVISAIRVGRNGPEPRFRLLDSNDFEIGEFATLVELAHVLDGSPVVVARAHSPRTR